MLQRKIEKTIEKHLLENNNKILIIEGARQIGKSYIIRNTCKKIYKNYVEINLVEDQEDRKAFESVRSTEDFYLRLNTLAGKKLGDRSNTIIFLDEIQAYPELLTLLKFLKDEDRYTYIVSGSLLGVTLNATLSKPGGRIEIIQMYPLDFEEWLWANGVGDEAIAHIRNKFEQEESLDTALHAQIMDLFKKYLLVGGLPDAVNRYIESRNLIGVRKTHTSIYNMYKEDAAQYDRQHSLAIRRVYELIPSNMNNRKKRVYYNEIEDKPQGRSKQYSEEFEYVVSSGIALETRAISTPCFPLIESTQKNLVKLYLNDVGLLTNLLYKYNATAILDDEKSINLGSVYETVVASELVAHGHTLYYYDNKSKGEVDFLIDDYDSLSAVPLEVKSGKDYTTHKSLDKFVSNEDYGIKKSYVLSNEREVRKEKKFIYMPIYYVMFMTPSTPKGILL